MDKGLVQNIGVENEGGRKKLGAVRTKCVSKTTKAAIPRRPSSALKRMEFTIRYSLEMNKYMGMSSEAVSRRISIFGIGRS